MRRRRDGGGSSAGGRPHTWQPQRDATRFHAVWHAEDQVPKPAALSGKPHRKTVAYPYDSATLLQPMAVSHALLLHRTEACALPRFAGVAQHQLMQPPPMIDGWVGSRGRAQPTYVQKSSRGSAHRGPAAVPSDVENSRTWDTQVSGLLAIVFSYTCIRGVLQLYTQLYSSSGLLYKV